MSREDLKPDYGQYLADQGIGDTTIVLPRFPIYVLSVRERGQYVVSANATVDGQEYMATIDFDQAVMDGLLDSLPERVSDGIHAFLAELDKRGDHFGSLEFGQPIVVTVEAKLGSVAHGEVEDFVPLVAKQISSSLEPE